MNPQLRAALRHVSRRRWGGGNGTGAGAMPRAPQEPLAGTTPQIPHPQSHPFTTLPERPTTTGFKGAVAGVSSAPNGVCGSASIHSVASPPPWLLQHTQRMSAAAAPPTPSPPPPPPPRAPRPEADIPPFTETLAQGFGSTEGQTFVFGVLGLTAATFFFQKLLTDTAEHAPELEVDVAEPVPATAAEEEGEAPAEVVVEAVEVQEPPSAEPQGEAEAEAEAEAGGAEGTVVEEVVSAEVESPEGTEAVVAEATSAAEASSGEAGGEGEAVAQGEDCPFCAFMRGGPCGEQFTAWEACVDAAAKEDMVEKCMAVTHELKLCMEQNEEYYGVILEAEKSLLEREEEQEGGAKTGEEVTIEAGAEGGEEAAVEASTAEEEAAEGEKSA